MKKSKFIAAALATTMFATAACGLIACDKDAGGLGTQTPTPTPTGKVCTITFNVETGATLKGIASGNTLKTGKDGKLTGVMPEAEKADSTFLGWTLTSGGKTAEITKTSYSSKVFTKDTNVYAVFAPNGGGGGGGGGGTDEGVFTITLETLENGVNGTCSDSSLTTTGGKLTVLPMVTPNDTANYAFEGWYTQPNGGGEKVSLNTSFTVNGAIYAHYTNIGGGGGGGGQTDPSHSTDGIYNGDTLVGALVVNGGNTLACTEYWFGGQSIKFTQGDTLVVYIGGEKVTNIYSPQGITGDGAGPEGASSELTVQSTGNYKVFLKLWDDSGNYTVEFAKDADIGDVTTLPSESCRVTISDGSTSIVLYFVDASGSPVTLSTYKIWAWADSGNLLANDWNDRPTMSANVSASNALGDKISFKITEGSTESNNLEGVATGKIYVVTIGANLKLTISEYTGN